MKRFASASMRCMVTGAVVLTVTTTLAGCDVPTVLAGYDAYKAAHAAEKPTTLFDLIGSAFADPNASGSHVIGINEMSQPFTATFTDVKGSSRPPGTGSPDYFLNAGGKLIVVGWMSSQPPVYLTIERPSTSANGPIGVSSDVNDAQTAHLVLEARSQALWIGNGGSVEYAPSGVGTLIVKGVSMSTSGAGGGTFTLDGSGKLGK